MQALIGIRTRVVRLAMFLPVFLTGCVSTSPGEQGILLETAAQGQPITGASCVATIGTLRWDVTTPAVLAVGGARGELHIVCNQPGFRTSELIFHPETNATSGGSASFGSGGYGSGFGLSIGFPLSSAAAPYPKRLVIDLNPA